MVHRDSRGGPASADSNDSVWDNVVLSWRLYRDPRVSNWIKRLPIVLAALYVIVPFDLIPDVFLGVGQLDDLGVIGLMMLALTWLPRFAPAEVVAEYRHGAPSKRDDGDDSQAKNARTRRAKQDDTQVFDPPFSVR